MENHGHRLADRMIRLFEQRRWHVAEKKAIYQATTVNMEVIPFPLRASVTALPCKPHDATVLAEAMTCRGEKGNLPGNDSEHGSCPLSCENERYNMLQHIYHTA